MRKNIILTSNGIIGTKFTKEFIEEKIRNKTVIIIDNGTYGTGNYNARQNNKEKFLEYGAKKVDMITLQPENQNLILEYEICYIMGGSIAELVKMVQQTDIRLIIRKFLTNGIYIGESAGSIILNEDVEWYFDLKRGTKPKYDVVLDSYQGIGLIEEKRYPHYDKEEEIGRKKINNYPEKIIPLQDGEYIEESDIR